MLDKDGEDKRLPEMRERSGSDSSGGADSVDSDKYVAPKALEGDERPVDEEEEIMRIIYGDLQIPGLSGLAAMREVRTGFDDEE